MRERLQNVMKWGSILRLPHNGMVKRHSDILSFVPSLMGVIFFANFLYLVCCTPSKEAHSIVSTSQVNRGIKKASRFLTQKIRDNAYCLFATSSDGRPCPVEQNGHVLSSFFIVDAMKDTLSEGEEKIIINRIKQEERDGLWGDGLNAPVDSDDTAFVLRMLKLLGKPISIEPLLRFYHPPSSAFKTFLVSRGRAELVFEKSQQNNFGIHPEVNANVFTLLQGTSYEKHINYNLITRSQTGEGYWHSYFYPSRYYGTYMALSVIHNKSEYKKSESCGINFILRTQNQDGSWGSPADSHETALALNALASCNRLGEAYQKGLLFLLNNQMKDGSWQTYGIIWEYVWRDDPKVVWKAHDSNRIITTSLAVKALSAFKHT